MLFISDMATRTADIHLKLLAETSGIEHLQFHGTKLPTYSQVILCFLAHLEKLRREDDTKQRKLTRFAANLVVK